MTYEINVDNNLNDANVANVAHEAVDCVKLYAKKNHDYGNSFEKGCDAIGEAYAVGRIYDKVNRLINLTKGVEPLFEETLKDTLQDLACYSLMYLAYLNKEKSIVDSK